MRLRLAVLLLLCGALIAACGSDDGDGGAAAVASATPAAASTPASAAGACPAATGKAPPAQVPGVPLRTVLRVPPAARGHRVPLVVALHFASGDSAQMEQTTKLTPEARRSGFAVAYPTATSEGFWQADTDLPKLQATIAAIERLACVDRRRLYVVGISNGGGMGSLMACRLADEVAAVALFAPAVSSTKGCAPSRPVPVLEVHGTADPLVPYAQGRDFVAGWARRDGCGATPRTARVGARASRLTWPGCRDGASVQHVALRGGKHIELLDELRAAKVDPAHTAWTFLRGHRLP